MHSFASANNKIVWTLALHGYIRAWADVKEEFDVVVTPFEPGDAEVPHGADEDEDGEEPEDSPDDNAAEQGPAGGPDEGDAAWTR